MQTRPGKGRDRAGGRRLPWLPYLVLAHHTDAHAGRTIGFRWLNWEQRFCTRCSGQWLGALACVAGMLAFGVELAWPVWCGVLVLSPLPALVDWVTQAWGVRESRTWLRLVTGFALGVGVGFQVVAGVRFEWLRFGLGVGVFGGYVLLICLLLLVRPARPGYMADLIDEVGRALGRRW